MKAKVTCWREPDGNRSIKLPILLSGTRITATFLLALAIACFPDRAFGQPAGKILPAQSALTISGIVGTPERKASPAFEGNQLPDPPAQRQAWQAPSSTLPKCYISAAKTLFDQGMADPRNCEYREIEIGTGNVWSGDNGVIKTHGWVLPGNQVQRFAVCWNGLVYPLVSVGSPADWRSDAGRAIENADEQTYFIQPEPTSVSWEACLPVKGCLLLRLGDAKLAQELWTSLQLADYRDQLGYWEKRTDEQRGPKPEFLFNEEDPYQTWAAAWAWSLFDRAVCAHMRGDDGLSWLSARKLDTMRPLLEAEADRRHIKRPLSATNDSGQPVPYFSFLDSLPVLLKDQKRRASEPERKSALDEIKAGNKTQSERIQLLIRDLDEVAVLQSGQPGGLGFIQSDPIVAALIREGELAIEPLLQCLENDAASDLTRSVTFGRDFMADRYLHPLVMPIREALLEIMKSTREAVGVSPKDLYVSKLTPGDEAARFRVYWQRFRSIPETERWYVTLTDDAAGKAAWMDAVEHLVRKTKSQQLAGESLRKKSHPSVSELLAARATELLRDRKEWHNSNQDFHNSDTVHFIRISMKWDAAPMLPAARELMRSIINIYGANPDHGHQGQMDGRNIGELAIARASTGDMEALNEWAEWIRKRLPPDLHSYPEESLEPLVRFPDHPAIKAAAAELFAKAGSPWRSFVSLGGRGLHPYHGDIRLSLLALTEVRDLWLELLANETIVGEAMVGENLGQSLKIPEESSSGWGGDPLLKGIPIGTKAAVRRCDEAAGILSRIAGIPAFSFFWSESRRDESISATRNLLMRNGKQLRVTISDSDTFQKFGIRFEFANRLKPANHEDVEAGAAIFHLEGRGDAHVFRLPFVPTPARMKNDEHEEVLVWQAEEIRSAGEVRRFYGIVGRHHIGMVTASDVELALDQTGH